MLRALLAHRVRGQALSELQVAILVGAIVLAAFVFLFARQVAASAAVNTYAANEAAVVSLFKESEDDAAAAQAVFSPAEDVGGNSNADGHAADVYQQDVAHVGHFFELCFKATSGACPASQSVGTLQRYAYSWSNLPQNGGSGATAQSSPITLFSGFTFRVLTTAAQYADSTLDPYAYAYFAKHPANFTGAKTYHWGFPGVTSSTNDLYVMTITLPNGEKRSVAFGKHHIVFAQDVIYGTATPTPNPMCAASCPQNSASLTFRNPIDSSQNETLLEANYGTRSTNPAQVYTVSGCTGTATFSPVSPVTPATDGSGSATLTIAPVKQLAPNGLTCTITTKDNANQSIPITVTIGKTYAPTSSGPGAGLSGQNGTFSVSEANYNTSPPGGFSASISGACNSIARTNASLNGSFTESETWTVHFASTGGCTVVFTDVYGQTTQNVTNVACSSYGTPCALNVSPTSTTICLNGNPCQISQSVSVSESNQFNAFAINDSGCRSGSYATANTSSIGSGGGAFTITAATAKTPFNQTCPVVVSDSNGQSSTVAVIVDPTPAPPATPSPPPFLVNKPNGSFQYVQSCSSGAMPQTGTCGIDSAVPADPLSDGKFTSSTNSVSIALSADTSCDMGPNADDTTFQLEYYTSPSATTPSATFNFSHMAASSLSGSIGPVSENVLLPRGAGTYDLLITAAGDDQANTNFDGTGTCTVSYSITVSQLANGAATTGP